MLNYNNFKNLNYKKSNRKLSKLRELINRLYGDYEYKKKLIEDLNRQLKRIKINIPTISEGILADLEVSDIVSVDKGHYLEFAITIKNIGEVATTEETNLILTIGDIEVELMVSVLAVNEEAVRYASFPYDPDAVDTYSLNINSEVNEERNIEESDYTNNILEKSFTIKENYQQTGLIVHAHTSEGIEVGSLNSQIIGGTNGFTIYVDDVYIGDSAVSYETHNRIIMTDFGLKNIRLEGNGIILTKNVTVIENQITVVYFIANRTLTSVEFVEEVDGLYYYRYLEEVGGAYMGLQGYSEIPSFSFVDSGFVYQAFFSAQSGLIATTVPYDLAGTGVKG